MRRIFFALLWRLNRFFLRDKCRWVRSASGRTKLRKLRIASNLSVFINSPHESLICSSISDLKQNYSFTFHLIIYIKYPITWHLSKYYFLKTKGTNFGTIIRCYIFRFHTCRGCSNSANDMWFIQRCLLALPTMIGGLQVLDQLPPDVKGFDIVWKIVSVTEADSAAPLCTQTRDRFSYCPSRK